MLTDRSLRRKPLQAENTAKRRQYGVDAAWADFFTEVNDRGGAFCYAMAVFPQNNENDKEPG